MKAFRKIGLILIHKATDMMEEVEFPIFVKKAKVI